MTTTGDVVATLIAAPTTAAAPAARIGRGICVSIDWTVPAAVVNFAGANVVMPMVGTPPIPNQDCLVIMAAGQPVCLGRPAGPSLGVVSAQPSGGRIAILGDDNVTYQAAYDPNITTWTTGQRVLLAWAGGAGGGPVVTLKLSADPAPPPDPVAPAPAPPPVVVKPAVPKARDLYFDAAWSGTQNGSGNTGNGNFWTNQVYAGSTTLGAWGYGSAVANTIPDGATINQVEIFLSAQQALYSGPNLGTHTLPSRSGVLTVSNAVNVALGSGWRGLPTSFGNALKTGAARGIATAHGGYSIFAPAGQNQSGRLHIRATW